MMGSMNFCGDFATISSPKIARISTSASTWEQLQAKQIITAMFT
jgi:hypothetical protein